MLDDTGEPIKSAGPSTPVEILGLSSAPGAGEPIVAVEDEARAREISEFRQRKLREQSAAGVAAGRGTLDQMLARIVAGEQKEVAVVVKADVQGSCEALQTVIAKLSHEEVRTRVLHAAVGQITESDVQLAKASNAVIIAFNVRATSQARALATRDAVDIRYYSIIYEVADDIEKLVKGKIAPKARENFLGYAEIRKVFNITKTGKVRGCMVTEGLVKRGAGVRLLRNNVVIHQGDLSQLKALQGRCPRSRPAATSAACPLPATAISKKATSSSASRWRWSRVEATHPASAAGRRRNSPRPVGGFCPRRGARPGTERRDDHGDGSADRAGSEACDGVRHASRAERYRGQAVGAAAGRAVPARTGGEGTSVAGGAGSVVSGGYKHRLCDAGGPADAAAGGRQGSRREVKEGRGLCPLDPTKAEPWNIDSRGAARWCA